MKRRDHKRLAVKKKRISGVEGIREIISIEFQRFSKRAGFCGYREMEKVSMERAQRASFGRCLQGLAEMSFLSLVSLLNEFRTIARLTSDLVWFVQFDLRCDLTNSQFRHSYRRSSR